MQGVGEQPFSGKHFLIIWGLAGHLPESMYGLGQLVVSLWANTGNALGMLSATAFYIAAPDFNFLSISLSAGRLRLGKI